MVFDLAIRVDDISRLVVATFHGKRRRQGYSQRQGYEKNLVHLETTAREVRREKGGDERKRVGDREREVRNKK
jgi:hypothetical protein